MASSTPAAPEVNGFVSMLKGQIPAGLDGQSWPDREAWFEHHREIIIGEAQAKSGEESGTKFNGAFRSTLMRFWNHKKPLGKAGGREDSSAVARRMIEDMGKETEQLAFEDAREVNRWPHTEATRA